MAEDTPAVASAEAAATSPAAAAVEAAPEVTTATEPAAESSVAVKEDAPAPAPADAGAAPAGLPTRPPGPPPGPPPGMPPTSGPPGPPPGAPPGRPPGPPAGGPPGPPAGMPPHAFPNYAPPTMRFGAYSGPPAYPAAGGYAPPLGMMMPNFPPPLPPGWSEHTAPDGLTRYYYNSQSRESTYVRPSFAPLPPPGPGFPAAPAAPAAAPGAPVVEKKKKKDKPKVKVTVPGTTWQRITTTEGHVFYFEKESKRSEWTVPDEIKEEVAELEEEERAMKAAADKEERERAEKERVERLREQERIRAEVEEERKRKVAAAVAKRKAAGEAGDVGDGEGDAKKARTENGNGAQGEDSEQYAPQGDEDEAEWMKAVAAEFAESDQKQQEQDEADRIAAQENVAQAAKTIYAVPGNVSVSEEEGRALFKALLLEKNISPFAPWDQSLPLFINDPRYVLLASEKARREVYEGYCRDVGRARRLKKNDIPGTVAVEAKKTDPEREYKALLREQVTSTRTRWDDWRRKVKKERRFYAFGRDDRERERVFKTHLKELGERKRADAQRAEEDFLELLREQDHLSSSSVWSEVKKPLASDARYDAVGSSSLRQELFDGYVRKLASGSNGAAGAAGAAASETPEQATERKAAEKKARQEASLRERQAKVGQDMQRVEKEVGKSRAGAGREEGERVFGSLLVDQVRDHEVTWNDASRFLASDPRYNHPSLSLGDKRRIFESHIARLTAKRSNALHDLFLARAPALDTAYDAVYPQLIEDPLVRRLGLDVHSLEERWDAWKRARDVEARGEFDAMLGENSFVDFWGKMRKKKMDEAAAELLKDEEEVGEDAAGEGLGEGGVRDLSEMAQQIDMNEIKAVLRRDKRYRQFDHVPELREQWLRQYLEGLGAASGSETIHKVGGAR